MEIGLATPHVTPVLVLWPPTYDVQNCCTWPPLTRLVEKGMTAVTSGSVVYKELRVEPELVHGSGRTQSESGAVPRRGAIHFAGSLAPRYLGSMDIYYSNHKDVVQGSPVRSDHGKTVEQSQ